MINKTMYADNLRQNKIAMADKKYRQQKRQDSILAYESIIKRATKYGKNNKI